jgi:hypothetical protein
MPAKVYDGGLRIFGLSIGLLGLMLALRAGLSLL